MADRATGSEHQAERACLAPGCHPGKAHSFGFVSPDVGDDGLIEASEGIVPGILAACLRERGIAALRELLRLVPCHSIRLLRRVDRHGDGSVKAYSLRLCAVVVPFGGEFRSNIVIPLHIAFHDQLRRFALLSDRSVRVLPASVQDRRFNVRCGLVPNLLNGEVVSIELIPRDHRIAPGSAQCSPHTRG